MAFIRHYLYCASLTFQDAFLKCLCWPWIKRGLFTAILGSTLVVVSAFLFILEMHVERPDLLTVLRSEKFRNASTRLAGDIREQSPAVQSSTSSKAQIIPGKPYCDKWSVVTTTFPLPDAIKQQVKLQDGWCMVIVGGKKEVPPYNITRTHPNVVYLDGTAQNRMSERYKLITYLPWDHIGRKNVGYLYAIEHGARTVWDINDGVVLNNYTNTHGLPTVPPILGKMVDVLIPNTEEAVLFNPYHIRVAPRSPCWTRELPQLNVKDSHSNSIRGYLDSLPVESIGIIHFLANQTPDVDLCRLKMHMPFNFDQTRRDSVMVPKESITPFISQATLFQYQSLWMLLLPVSVTDRLSDIWRSFIAQRLVWELKNPQYFLLSAPLVNRSWNSNNTSYLNINETAGRHNRSLILIRFLHKWKPSSRDLMSMIEELWIALHERNFIDLQDVALIRFWLQALAMMGYSFPEVRQCQESTWPPFDMLIPIGATHQDEFRSVFLRSLKLFWPKPLTNLVMMLDEDMENREEFAGTLLNWTAGLNNATIAYNKPSQYYGADGHDRQQLIMFWADNFTNADRVGFVDTDTLFVTVPDSDDLFEDGDKPVVNGVYGKPQGKAWSKMPNRTMFSLGKPEVLRCMAYFPVIIKTKHLKEMRDYMTALHNASHFDQVFSTIKAKRYSQFNIMCNYLWWFHRDEYAWHVMEREPGWQGVPPLGQVTSFKEAGITHKMLYPKPRVAIHMNHHATEGQNVDFFLRQGYCTYLHTQFSHQSVTLRPECRDLDKQGYNPNLFMFEFADWQYHTKHQEAFQRRQNRFRRSNSCHAFESKATNLWKKEIRLS